MVVSRIVPLASESTNYCNSVHDIRSMYMILMTCIPYSYNQARGCARALHFPSTVRASLVNERFISQLKLHELVYYMVSNVSYVVMKC